MAKVNPYGKKKKLVDENIKKEKKLYRKQEAFDTEYLLQQEEEYTKEQYYYIKNKQTQIELYQSREEDDLEEYCYDDFAEPKDLFSNSLLTRGEARSILNGYFLPVDVEDEHTESEPYTDESYKMLNQNVILHKQGSREGTEYIIKAFHKLLLKYTNFITAGMLSFSLRTDKNGRTAYHIDKAIGSLVDLFTTKEDMKEIRSRTERFTVVSKRIRELFSSYDYCEIYDELVIALLTMANRYKVLKPGDKYYKENGTFHMYVQKCLHFEIKSRLNGLIKDSFARNKNVYFIDEHDEEYNPHDIYKIFIEDEQAVKEFNLALDAADRELRIKMTEHLTMKEDNIDLTSFDMLNFNWTSGVTCSELFSTLSPMEREILVLNYAQRISIEKISKLFHVNKATINNYKKKAVQKIIEQAKLLGIRL